MLKRLISGAVSTACALTVLWLAGCGSAAAATTIKPTWITPEVKDSTISVPISAIDKYTIVLYWVDTPAGKESFMAYKVNGTDYVRADECVPCRSTSFSLTGNTLSCDTCGTQFSAVTGKGIVEKGCGAYPKEAVTFQKDNGQLVMTMADLESAYDATLKIG